MNIKSIKNREVLIITGYQPLNTELMKKFGASAGVQPYAVLPSFNNKKSINVTVPSLGAICVASFLKKRGIDVEVKDYYMDQINFTGPEIIGISSTFMELEHIKEIVKSIRTQNSRATIVMGGPLSWSITPGEIFKDVPDLDIIVYAEGEETFFELVTSIFSKKPLENIKGIVFKQKGKIFKNQFRNRFDIDFLPVPDWSLINLEKRLNVLPIETARGCSYNCAFCNEANYWGKPVRFRKIEDVLNEIKYNISEFGINTFRFVDSCFTAPEKRCAAICDCIYSECIEKGINIKWSSYARVNNLSNSLLKKMKLAGCIALDVGLESGDQRILNNMKKNYDPQKIITCVQTAKELGIIIHCNTLIGFPGETLKTIDNTVKVLDKAKPDSYQCLYLYVSPNTYLYENKEKYRIVGNGHNWKHFSMTSEQAENSIYDIFNRLPDVTMFPGGEFFSCYLTALNFSVNEIKCFFKATNRLCRGIKDKKDILLVDKIDKALREYW